MTRWNRGSVVAVPSPAPLFSLLPCICGTYFARCSPFTWRRRYKQHGAAWFPYTVDDVYFQHFFIFSAYMNIAHTRPHTRPHTRATHTATTCIYPWRARGRSCHETRGTPRRTRTLVWASKTRRLFTQQSGNKTGRRDIGPSNQSNGSNIEQRHRYGRTIMIRRRWRAGASRRIIAARLHLAARTSSTGRSCSPGFLHRVTPLSLPTPLPARRRTLVSRALVRPHAVNMAANRALYRSDYRRQLTREHTGVAYDICCGRNAPKQATLAWRAQNLYAPLMPASARLTIVLTAC